MYEQAKYDPPGLIEDQFNDESHKTVTSFEQCKVEALVQKCFNRFEQLMFDPNLPQIYRNEHIRFIESSVRHLSQSYECLDSSRPWLVYWILNAAQLLGHRWDETLQDNIIDFLIQCRSPEGGFGGGPGQYPHLAPTYAAVNSLCIIGTERALHAINRKTLKNFLMAVREPNGAFRLHVDGEIDIRGVYCAVAVARLSNYSQEDMAELFEKTVEWICSCQTYEGGIGGAPDLEAHGGYAFCGVAALALLGTSGSLNLKALLRWAINRQMKYEGGFQGRTNKLVDGCYSFWQGAIMPIVQALIYNQVHGKNAEFYTANNCKEFEQDEEDADYKDRLKYPMFHRRALQEYILICCQAPNGGLIDKPGKPPDLYHTCYTLSGLAIAQHCENDMSPLVLGNPNNELNATHPMYNIPAKSVWKAGQHFRRHYRDLYLDNDADSAERQTHNDTNGTTKITEEDTNSNRRAESVTTTTNTEYSDRSSDRESSVATTASTDETTSSEAATSSSG